MPLYEQKPCKLCGIIGEHSTEDCRNYQHTCTYCKEAEQDGPVSVGEPINV
jgi:hypothetical protein